MSRFLTVAIAVFLDRLLGEPAKYHPLRGFARIANLIEQILHGHEELIAAQSKQLSQIMAIMVKAKGLFAVLFLVLLFVTVVSFLQHILGPLAFLLDILVLYLAIGANSLKQHALDVQKALSENNIEEARKKVALIVSRDTVNLDSQGVLLGCVESVLENGSDAIMAPIFWFLVLGAPGVVLYRLANTLDAMWGYKNTRYINFGWAAARLDDLLNFIPARLTALSYVLLGEMRSGLQCLLKQGKTWYSPNAGPVMAAGAGALQIQIGGDAYYDGQIKNRPQLGVGQPPQLTDISRSLSLVDRSMILWLAFILVFSLSHC